MSPSVRMAIVGTGSVYGNSDWVWAYDPVAAWNKEPAVPTAYAA